MSASDGRNNSEETVGGRIYRPRVVYPFKLIVLGLGPEKIGVSFYASSPDLQIVGTIGEVITQMRDLSFPGRLIALQNIPHFRGLRREEEEELNAERISLLEERSPILAEIKRRRSEFF